MVVPKNPKMPDPKMPPPPPPPLRKLPFAIIICDMFWLYNTERNKMLFQNILTIKKIELVSKSI